MANRDHWPFQSGYFASSAACAPPTVISPEASAIAIATVQLRSTMMTSSTFQAHRSQSTQPLLRSNGTKEKVEYTACAAHGKAQRKARRSVCGIAASPLSAPGNEALRQGEAVLRDIAGARVPDAILALVLDAMFDRLAQWPQPERLPDDEAVQRQPEDQRRPLGLLQKLLELVHNHLGELAAGVVAMREGAGVVELHRIGHRQQRSGAGLHPDRLVVKRPVEEMRIAGLLEEIGRGIRFERTRPHPPGRPHPDMFLDDRGAFLDRAPLIVLPHAAQQFGIGAAMAQYVVTARPDLVDDLRIVVADGAVEQDRGRQLQLVQDFEQAPISDAVAVVAPGEIARGLHPAAHRVHAEARAEGEVLDVERDVEGEPLAAGPGIFGALNDGRISITGMAGK